MLNLEAAAGQNHGYAGHPFNDDRDGGARSVFVWGGRTNDWRCRQTHSYAGKKTRKEKKSAGGGWQGFVWEAAVICIGREGHPARKQPRSSDLCGSLPN